MAATVASQHSVELKRQIGLYAATAITVGTSSARAFFARRTGRAGAPGFSLVILAWIVGGVLRFGSLVLTELAVRHPRLAAVCVHREASSAWAFTFGWVPVGDQADRDRLDHQRVRALLRGAGLPQHEFVVVRPRRGAHVHQLAGREGSADPVAVHHRPVIGIIALCVFAFVLPSTRRRRDPTPGRRRQRGTPGWPAFALAMIGILFAYEADRFDLRRGRGDQPQPPADRDPGRHVAASASTCSPTWPTTTLTPNEVAGYGRWAPDIHRPRATGARVGSRCWSRSRPSAPPTARSSPARA